MCGCEDVRMCGCADVVRKKKRKIINNINGASISLKKHPKNKL